MEGSLYLDRLLALAERDGMTTPSRIQAVLEAGFMACFRGDYPLTRTLARQALALSEALGDRRGLARAHRLLGEAEMQLGEVEEAQRLFERELALAREVDDLVLQDDAYNMLGETTRRLGRYDEATAHLERGLTVSRAGHHINVIAAAVGGSIASAMRPIVSKGWQRRQPWTATGGRHSSTWERPRRCARRPARHSRHRRRRLWPGHSRPPSRH